MAKATGERPKQQLHSIRDHIYGQQQYKPLPWTDRDQEAMDYFLYSKLYDPCGNYAPPVWIRPSAIVAEKPVKMDYTWRGEGNGLSMRDAGGMENG